MEIKQAIKRYLNNGSEYTTKELAAIIKGYVNNEVSDALMTQFLKSIFDYGLSIAQTAALTDIMMHSGDVINLDQIPGLKVDKHSTGGVGDKVTLIVAPLVASLGGIVAKMSGRGLGFTGGTIDKLESIPGYQINQTNAEFADLVTNHHVAVIGQTNNIVPADKKIYALRDETNLVGSLPLIASSIMSKKLATGANAILLDVKCGDAAFMKTQAEAEALAKVMIELGQHLGKEVRAEITTMDQPLGKAIGNKNEVLEAIAFLKGEFISADLEEVIYSSATTLLLMGKVFDNEEKALAAIRKAIASGAAFAKFKEWIKAQNGDLTRLLSPDFWQPQYQQAIFAPTSGFFTITSAVEFGISAMKLGAGRAKKEDSIDYEAGINLNVKTGAKVQKGDLLFTLFASQPIDQKIVQNLAQAFTINDQKVMHQTILNKL